MKTLTEILQQPPIYLHGWSGKIDVISDFDNIYITKKEYEAEKSPFPNSEYWEENKKLMTKAIEEWRPINILFASYGYENYSGDAYVLFERDGKLFDVIGGHCSCYGLEGQFSPTETTLEAIKMRLIDGKLGKDDYSGNEFNEELRKFLGV